MKEASSFFKNEFQIFTSTGKQTSKIFNWMIPYQGLQVSNLCDSLKEKEQEQFFPRVISQNYASGG